MHRFFDDPPVTVLLQEMGPSNWKATWWRRKPGAPRSLLIPEDLLDDDPLGFGVVEGKGTSDLALSAALVPTDSLGLERATLSPAREQCRACFRDYGGPGCHWPPLFVHRASAVARS